MDATTPELSVSREAKHTESRLGGLLGGWGNPIARLLRIYKPRGRKLSKNSLQEADEEMKKLIPFLYFVLMSFAPVAPAYAAPPQAAAPMHKTLYQRLGGYDALAAVSDDFLGRLASDPQMGRFFVGLSTDSKVKVRQHIVDFLCVATGGPCKYMGRDMKTAHTGLGITEADWTQMVKLLGQTFDKFSVPEKERADVVGAVAGLKADIVGR